jgi:hypothetical protein
MAHMTLTDASIDAAIDDIDGHLPSLIIRLAHITRALHAVRATSHREAP